MQQSYYLNYLVLMYLVGGVLKHAVAQMAPRSWAVTLECASAVSESTSPAPFPSLKSLNSTRKRLVLIWIGRIHHIEAIIREIMLYTDDVGHTDT